jgi:hypothetical protein
MTLQADGVDLGAIEQVRTRAAMRKVACGAAFGLHYGMFIHKRPGDFRVALRADDVLLRGRPLKLLSKSAVWFMTIRAQDQSLFHLVTRGHGECGLLVIMALKAELRFRCFEQILWFTGTMDAMAVDATFIALTVGRALKD